MQRQILLLVNVMTGGQGGVPTPAPATTNKPKAKAKAKSNAKSTALQNAKTPAEVKDAIRNPIQVSSLFFFYVPKLCCPSFLFVPPWNALFNLTYTLGV